MGGNSGWGDESNELPGTTGDPLVHLIEHFAPVVYRIPDRSRLNGTWVEIAEDDDIGGPAAEALDDRSLLAHLHDHDEIRCPSDFGRYEPGPVIGQLESVALGGGDREGRGWSVEPDESGGADDDAGGRELSRQQRARYGTATDVAVADDQHRLGRRTVA